MPAACASQATCVARRGEELGDEEQPQHHEGRHVHDLERRGDDDGEDLAPRLEHEVRAHHHGDGAGRADDRHRRVCRFSSDVAERGDHAADEVERAGTAAWPRRSSTLLPNTHRNSMLPAGGRCSPCRNMRVSRRQHDDLVAGEHRAPADGRGRRSHGRARPAACRVHRPRRAPRPSGRRTARRPAIVARTGRAAGRRRRRPRLEARRLDEQEHDDVDEDQRDRDPGDAAGRGVVAEREGHVSGSDRLPSRSDMAIWRCSSGSRLGSATTTVPPATSCEAAAGVGRTDHQHRDGE